MSRAIRKQLQAVREKSRTPARSTFAGWVCCIPGIPAGFSLGLIVFGIGYPSYFSDLSSAAFLGIFFAVIGGAIGFFIGRKIVRDLPHDFWQVFWSAVVITPYTLIPCFKMVGPMLQWSWRSVVLYLAIGMLVPVITLNMWFSRRRISWRANVLFLTLSALLALGAFFLARIWLAQQG